MALGNAMAKKHPLLLSFYDVPRSVSPTLPLPRSLTLLLNLSHPPTNVLPPTTSPLRALDECGGLIAFFRERISMSCRECSGLMHKEQAARVQKWGAGDSLLPLSTIGQTLGPRGIRNRIK